MKKQYLLIYLLDSAESILRS